MTLLCSYMESGSVKTSAQQTRGAKKATSVCNSVQASRKVVESYGVAHNLRNTSQDMIIILQYLVKSPADILPVRKATHLATASHKATNITDTKGYFVWEAQMKRLRFAGASSRAQSSRKSNASGGSKPVASHQQPPR
eukprot:scaffold75141_cov37-Prasinocladus_malaysianus.AAC.1